MTRLIALLAVMACYGGYRVPAAPKTASLKVVGWDEYIDHIRWMNSPWYRNDDTDYPVFILIGDGNMGCRVDGGTFAVTLMDSYFSCPTPWRFARLSH